MILSQSELFLIFVMPPLVLAVLFTLISVVWTRVAKGAFPTLKSVLLRGVLSLVVGIVFWFAWMFRARSPQPQPPIERPSPPVTLNP